MTSTVTDPDAPRSGSSPGARASTAPRSSTRWPPAVRRHRREVLDAVVGRAGPGRREARAHRARRHPPGAARRQRGRRLRRGDRLDAHVLARRRCGSPASTRCASRCCTCTPRPTRRCRGPTIDMDFMNLNQAAHGDREFGVHPDPARRRPQDRGRSRRRPRGGPSGRRLGARRPRARRDARPAAGPVRRQHARRRRHRGRQGRGRAALRRLGQHLRRQRPGRGRRRRSTDARHRHAGRGVRRHVRRRRPTCCPAGTGTSRCATAPASSWGCGSSSPTAASRRSPPTSRTSAGCGSCPGWPCSG